MQHQAREGWCREGWKKPENWALGSLTYQTVCIPCLKSGKVIKYIGQTSTKIKERGEQHHDEAAKNECNNEIRKRIFLKARKQTFCKTDRPKWN